MEGPISFGFNMKWLSKFEREINYMTAIQCTCIKYEDQNGRINIGKEAFFRLPLLKEFKLSDFSKSMYYKFL
jgi:hypothetical protein